MKVVFKLNGIEIKKLTDFIVYLDHIHRHLQVSFFGNLPKKRWLWILYGLYFLLSHIFANREQVTSLEEIIGLKIKYFLDNENKLKPPNENINNKINEYLNNLPPIKKFLSNNKGITIDNLLKKYPIFSEQQRLKNDNTIPPQFKLEIFDDFKKNILTQIKPGYPRYITYVNEISNWIDKKGFLLFYKDDDLSQLKKFFTDKETIEIILKIASTKTLINLFHTVLECLTLFSNKDKEEIISFVRENYPLRLITNSEQQIEKALKEYDKNLFTFLKNWNKQQIEEIFNALAGLDIAISNEFFNVDILEETIDKIKDEDFNRLLQTMDKVIDWMNEEVNKNKNEFDFWLDNDKVSYYFKFLYLLVNIYFNYTYNKLEKEYNNNINSTN